VGAPRRLNTTFILNVFDTTIMVAFHYIHRFIAKVVRERSLAAFFCAGILSGPTAAVAAGAEAGSNASNHVLSTNDRIEIRVYQEDDLTGQYRIAEDGTVNFPLTGTIRLGGKTTDEAATLLTGALRKYLKKPHVNIAVSEFAKRRYTIMGQVQRPGAYLLPTEDKLNVMGAIAAAGGFTRTADTTSVSIKRNKPNGDSIRRINMKELGGESDFEVLEGDHIMIGERLF
jgi:protein involved in polysaccharide export with SLBB domain